MADRLPPNEGLRHRAPRVAAASGFVIALACLGAPGIGAAADQAPAGVAITWDQRIPMRDGVTLSAVIWTPRGAAAPLPAIVTITPYGAQRTNPQAQVFARHGYVVVSVDSRGRGNSGGVFRPFRDDGPDGFDVIEWVAAQPWCNGKVGSWGGSYSGFNQWATMKQHPPHLATAIPRAPAGLTVDIPMNNNIVPTYLLNWLAMVSGRVMNTELAEDDAHFGAAAAEQARQGLSFRDLDVVAGIPSPSWREFLDHPMVDAYWDALLPGPADYARLRIPILTITGHYDGDQRGALKYYREFVEHAPVEARGNHFVIVGPWDHRGTLDSADRVGDITFGPHSVIPMRQIEIEWYDWALKGTARPAFLRDQVSYYVAGRDEWRYAAGLAGMHDDTVAYYLSADAISSPDVYHAGYLVPRPGADTPASVSWDPRELAAAPWGAAPELVYYTAPLAQAVTVSGTAAFEAYIAIDQADADIGVDLEEVLPDGRAVPLASDIKRARYNRSLRAAEPVTPGAITKYVFSTFTLFSRELAAGSRVRLRVHPLSGPEWQRNMNGGGSVSDETVADARTVRITLHHGERHPSRLVLPVLR